MRTRKDGKPDRRHDNQGRPRIIPKDSPLGVAFTSFTRWFARTYDTRFVRRNWRIALYWCARLAVYHGTANGETIQLASYLADEFSRECRERGAEVSWKNALAYATSRPHLAEAIEQNAREMNAPF